MNKLDHEQLRLKCELNGCTHQYCSQRCEVYMSAPGGCIDNLNRDPDRFIKYCYWSKDMHKSDFSQTTCLLHKVYYNNISTQSANIIDIFNHNFKKS